MEKSKRASRKLAILLNALILPGLGHIVTGFKIRGTILVVLTVFFIAAPITKYALITASTINIITPSKSTTSAENILMALKYGWPFVSSVFFTAIAGILILWVYGIIDIYFKFKQKETNL